MKTHLHLFLDWGIKFEEPYILPEKATRKVPYVKRGELMRAISEQEKVIAAESEKAEPSAAASGGHKQAPEKPVQIIVESEKHHTPYNLEE